MRRPLTALVALALLAAIPAAAPAAAEPSFTLTLKDHHFAPPLTIPAKTRVRLVVKNLDPTPAEFESDDFTAEKIVPAGGQITVLIGPLAPGRYEYHDEYHEDVSKTYLTVR